MSSPGLACPCCGCLTLPSHGTFDICPVCFWEDDFTCAPDDDRNPNNMTLREARANLAAWGAVEPRLVHWTRPPQPGEAPEGTPFLGQRPYDRWPTAVDFPGGVRFGWIGPPAPARWWRRQAFVVLADGRRAGLTVTADGSPGAPPAVVRAELMGSDRNGLFDLHLPGPRSTDDDALAALHAGLVDVVVAAVPVPADSWAPVRHRVGSTISGSVRWDASPDEPEAVARWAESVLRAAAEDVTVPGRWSWVGRRSTDAGLSARAVTVHDLTDAVPPTGAPAPLPETTRCLLEWSDVVVPH